MQERESSNGLALPIKRFREEDSSSQENSSFKLKDLIKNSFYSYTHQSGKAKSFWYIHNLNSDLENSNKKLQFSDWFHTGDYER